MKNTAVLSLFVLAVSVFSNGARAFTYQCEKWGATLDVGGPTIKISYAKSDKVSESVGNPTVEKKFYVYAFDEVLSPDAAVFENVQLRFPKAFLEGKKKKGTLVVVDSDEAELFSAECEDTTP
jgi:hypothetical protein